MRLDILVSEVFRGGECIPQLVDAGQKIIVGHISWDGEKIPMVAQPRKAVPQSGRYFI